MSVMTSTSNFNTHKSFTYDVFLSFRGDDTRKNFVNHLYFALQQKNINTYKDDERIKKGKKISDELIKSIEDSKFYIIVFSKNYASSSWCLNELVKIMECHRTTHEHAVYPIFYDVEPSEVRKQTGAVGKAFAKHKRETCTAKWIEALKEAADLAGWELKNTFDGHEAKFIQKVVDDISLDLCNSKVDEKLIGMEIQKKDALLCSKSGFDDIAMNTIKEIGGNMKESLTKAACDKITSQFEGKRFVENVRIVSKASMFGMKLLQKHLRSDLLKEPRCRPK